MTQQGMVLAGEVVGGEIERAARAHARASGLAFARVERARDLFGGPLEVAVFRTRSGAEIRRTLAQIQQS